MSLYLEDRILAELLIAAGDTRLFIDGNGHPCLKPHALMEDRRVSSFSPMTDANHCLYAYSRTLTDPRWQGTPRIHISYEHYPGERWLVMIEEGHDNGHAYWRVAGASELHARVECLIKVLIALGRRARQEVKHA